MLVSHDRYLIDRLTDQLFIFEGGGKVRIYSGNYTDYRLEQDELKKPSKPEWQTSKSLKADVPSKKLSYKEEKELQEIEDKIKILEKEVLSLTRSLNSGIIDHEELSEISVQIELKTQQIDDKTLRWLELTD